MEIQSIVAGFNFSSSKDLAPHSVSVKGIPYKKGLLLPLVNNDEGIVLGRIELILVRNSCEVFFLTSVYRSLLRIDSGLHCLLNYDPACLDIEYRCTASDALFITLCHVINLSLFCNFSLPFSIFALVIMSIQESVRAVLPTLSSNVIERVAETLVLIGVESSVDLQYEESDHLKEHLLPIQMIKLLHA